MPIRNAVVLGWLALGCAVAAAPASAQADDLAALDALVRDSAQPAPGIALARTQLGEGDLIGAVATLERVLVDHPQADEALLLHASLLCRLDDRKGAEAELAALRPVARSEAGWADVAAACGPAARRGS